VRQQIDQIGMRLDKELRQQHYNLPVLSALDAVLDDQDKLWWLEANSNPALPPTGYPLVLATIFEGKDVPAKPVLQPQSIAAA
jgi:hypothetical protein